MGILVLLIAALVLGFVMMQRWKPSMLPWHLGSNPVVKPSPHSSPHASPHPTVLQQALPHGGGGGGAAISSAYGDGAARASEGCSGGSCSPISSAYVPWTGDHLAGIKSIGSKHMVSNVQDPSTLGLVKHNHLFASKRSRLRALADPIRGDLPIVPKQGPWTPSVTPHIDLHPGSLNVLAGHNNALGQQMAHLVHTSSGGAERQIGGISF